MPCATSIEEAVSLACQRWTGYEFRIENNNAAVGPCPVCGLADDDGFIIYYTGFFECRPGSHRGWIDDDKQNTLTPEEKERRRTAATAARALRIAEENAKRLTALERMNRCQDHIKYHKQLDDRDLLYWSQQGMFPETISAYQLGVCYRCPTDSEHRPSYTIPVINGGKLVNIRHRLLGFDGTPVDGDKYRPHMSGLGSTLFHADNLYNGKDRVIIVEGAKKGIVTSQYGYNSVAIFGAGGFKPHWAKRFEQFKEIIIALDPDVKEKAYKLASLFGSRGKVAHFPVKPDDFFRLGGTTSDFDNFLRLARKGIH